MEERLTKEQVDILVSSIRRGIPLPEDKKITYANNVRALLKLSDTMITTCELLAQECVAELKKYEGHIDSKWSDDVAEEIQWWWMWVQKLRAEGKLDGWMEFKKAPFPFEKFVPQFAHNDVVRVLNIGSGPRSTMGEQTSFPQVKIVNMDPLAPAYNKLMGLLNAPGTGDIIFGAVEILSKLNLPKYNFISAKNCLDHAYDVPHGIREIVGCLADRGMIELVHYENEGEAQNYMGMHKWNIEIKDSKIRIWNQNSSQIFNHEEYGLDLYYERVMTKKGTGVPHPQINIRLSRGVSLPA